MTKHVVEALLIGLALLAAAHLAPRRDAVMVCAALAIAAFVVGLVLVVGG